VIIGTITITITMMYVYHKYLYSNTAYFDGVPDVNTYTVYYDGEFADMGKLKYHIVKTCHLFHNCYKLEYLDAASENLDIVVHNEKNDVEKYIKIKDNVASYLGNFIVEDKCVTCIYIIYEKSDGISRHQEDRTRQTHTREQYDTMMSNFDTMMSNLDTSVGGLPRHPRYVNDLAWSQ
jgi:hypothetical protein